MYRRQQLQKIIAQSSQPKTQLRGRLLQKTQRSFAVKQAKSPTRPYMEASAQQEPIAAKPSPFAHDSTPELIKKMFIYKMMSSNVFINYSLGAMSLAYRTMGRKVTNTLIEQTAGTIFTGGVSVSDLCKDMDVLEKRNIGTISMMVVEGLTNAEESTLDYFYAISKDTVQQMSEGRPEAHFAVKLTAFVSLEVMEKMSGAQKKFVHDVLALDYADRSESSILTREQLVSNLREAGIVDYSESDLNQLVEQLSDEQGRMTPVSRYLGGHLFNLYRPMTGLEVQMAEQLGGMEQSDFEKYASFVDRTLTFTDYANERNTSLYVDAEQSFIQYGIESFGQQLTHKYNRGDKVIIMNGYQCYTTRTQELIPMEVEAAKQAGFNMGIKLIRGAYMMEERELAAQGGYESPVFDTIEGTHECYNKNMEHIITNMKE